MEWYSREHARRNASVDLGGFFHKRHHNFSVQYGSGGGQIIFIGTLPLAVELLCDLFDQFFSPARWLSDGATFRTPCFTPGGPAHQLHLIFVLGWHLLLSQWVLVVAHGLLLSFRVKTMSSPFDQSNGFVLLLDGDFFSYGGDFCAGKSCLILDTFVHAINQLAISVIVHAPNPVWQMASLRRRF